MSPSPAPERIAVIVVHGIGDQVRGETAEMVALQLAAGSATEMARSELPITVPPLAPAVSFERWQPQGWIARSRKSLRQSLRSDFLDARLGEQPSPAGEPVALRNSAVHVAHGPRAVDHGVRFTDYLLAKAASVRSGAEAPRYYEMPCLQLRGAARHTDVFEMYWTDLSRLGSSTTRMLGELFTLIFHLATLGTDTLSLAAALQPGDAVLRVLGRCHRVANWLFSRVLALLFLQLFVCMLLVVPSALLVGNEAAAACGGAVLGGVAVAVACVYRWRMSWVAGLWAGLASAALLLCGAVSGPAAAAWVLVAAGLAGLLWVYCRFLAYCEERFRAVYGTGLALMALTLAALAWGALSHESAGAGERLVAGTMRVVEVVLMAQLSGWVLMAGLVSVAVVLGEWACFGRRGSAALRQSVVTARLGLFVSMGIFVALVMTLWALVSPGLESLVAGLHYTPWWFTDAAPGQAILTDHFLRLRFTASTDTFAMVAAMLLALLGFIALVFVPSVLVELRIVSGVRAAQLGHWLTAGYRAIDRLVHWWSWLIMGALISVAVLLAGSQLARLGIALPWLGLVSLPVQTVSGALLGKVVWLIAGSALSLVGVGGMAIKKLKALRGPLDAALDVDNYFREFPRDEIPRVMIFERYVAVLEHVLAQGYQRIVIASHSQGTVISADLLRYLQQRQHLLEADAASDRLTQLGTQLSAHNIRLLTAGSPLRQLYALRFPGQYAWVLGDQGAFCGPGPRSDLGVAHWVNAWGAGDYVGRWLWSPAGASDLPALAVDERAYEGTPTQHAPDYRDLCVGADAHTHYFELSNALMRSELHTLV